MLFAIMRAQVSTQYFSPKLHLKLVIREATISQNKAKFEPDSREDQVNILPIKVIFR